jgi:predicted ATPase/class 3 adenylate cyclase
MVILPSGTVTFLFTDIEGSTRLWEKHPEAMKTALARHNSLLREKIELHGGYIFKTMGDSSCAAFCTAPAGLEASLAIQRTLLTETWGETPIRVRVALHTGNVQERDGDYFGPPLNRVARLLSAGHGGQTLLSAATQELVCDQLAHGVRLRDLGERRLKDLDRAEHIYQLVVPDLPADYPPLTTMESFPHNLPLQLTSFVGREKEIAEVKRLLGTARLLTLTGPGGTGKTRLSLQVAADVLDRFPDGVWLVEFAPITNPALIPQTVASVLGVREEPGMPIIQTLISSLLPKLLLMVLDNCEHLIEDMAQFVQSLLHACPTLQVLTSSREILGIAGETSFRVPSLSVPALSTPGAGAIDLQALTQYEAVRLFIERAQAIRSEFQLTNANAPSMVNVCQRLDGIPLAIELAAVRIKALSVEQISSRIDDRFRLLTGGIRTALPRHQTLRALIDWSYDLLSPTEQILLNRLAVFVGGWSLEAAEFVCNDLEILSADDVLDVLTHLVDKSLVVMEEARGEARYRMLETIRQHARDKMLESGEAERLHERHLDYFLAFAQGMDGKLHGPAELEALEKLEGELDNLRLALDWSLGEGHIEKGLNLAGTMWGFWEMQGYWQEGHTRVQSLLVNPAAAVRNLARAKGLLVAADLVDDTQAGRVYLEELLPLARELGEAGSQSLALGLGALSWQIFAEEPARAEVMLEEGISLARKLNQPRITATLLRSKGWFLLGKRDYSASRQAFEESLDLSLAAGDRRMAALSLRGAAGIRFIQYDFVTPIQQFEEVLQIFREIKDRPRTISTLTMLAEMERANGRYDMAKMYCIQADALSRELGIRNKFVPFNLGSIALHEGDLNTARTHFAEALMLAQECHNHNNMAYAMLGYGGVLAVEKKAWQSVVLLSFHHAFFEAGDRRYYTPTDEIDYEHYLAIARVQLDEVTFQAAWAEGKAMTLEQAVAYAVGW